MLKLDIWRLHPDGCPIVPAEKTLGGGANRGAVRWCGPFTNANRAGWWVFPPLDIDIVWKGGREFEHEVVTPYSDADYHLIRFLLDDEEATGVDTWLPAGGRTKLTWGLVEDGVVQIWTGCIFRTPPGWGLHIRSPINFPAQPYRVMEAILETDWLQYDIWLNIVFDRQDEVVRLRRDQWPPVAHLVPVRRESYDARWEVQDSLVRRDGGEGEQVLGYFADYNRKKFAGVGEDPMSASVPTPLKDSATYYKERKRALGAAKQEAQ